jgi:hypothetical protein
MKAMPILAEDQYDFGQEHDADLLIQDHSDF